jgi:predicted transcriptional regulator
MSKQISVRVPDDAYMKLAEQAKQERRTVSNLVNALIADYLERQTTSVKNPKPKA